MTRHASKRLRPLAGSAALVALALAGCSVSTGTPGGGADEDGGRTTVTLLTHDSFALPDEVVRTFETESGFDLEIVQSGDAGELTNRLVLTADDPLGDAVFGVDTTFAGRAVEAGVLAEYQPEALPPSAQRHRLTGEGAEVLTPVDWGDVCVNVDDRWFAERGTAPPRTLDDLVAPAYRDLFVVPAASTSSPGFAFLLATIGAYGEDGDTGWQGYWERLVANGVKVVSGWSDAYEVDFSASGGDRPIVVSYHSSPPFTVPEGGQRPTTSALLDTCFRQVEYAGVLAGADNPAGAEALVDFMVSEPFQRALPESMYVVPVDDRVALPEAWARWAVPAPDPLAVPADRIAENRRAWVRKWADLTAR